MDNEQKAREILEYCWSNISPLDMKDKYFMEGDEAEDMIEQIKFLMEND